jgi:hypothetical protein
MNKDNPEIEKWCLKMKIHKKTKNIVFYRFLISTLLLLIFAAACLSSVNSKASQSRESIDSLVIDKIFPFYNYVARNQTFAYIIQEDPILKKQVARQLKRIKTALEQCDHVACYDEAAQWNSGEIDNIGNRLVELLHDKSKMHQILPVLRTGKHYKLYDTQPDTAYIRSVWTDAARGVNRILDTYIKGEKPRYPAIDAISFSVDDPEFQERVYKRLAELVNEHSSKDLFFKLPLQLAIWALAINGRDEAIRYEPLDQGMNESTVRNLPGVQWSLFPYSLILVPGQGPEQEGMAIDPISITRCRMAAERFQKRLAPIIVVSGGHVHPNKTPYSEAVEMKKYMVQELQIPENTILIEPHARHTTTNIRNTVRLVYRFKIPDNMKILTVTDSFQSAYIPRMEKRFMDELGYIPYRDMKILSAEENEFYPIKTALQINPFDPLDP